MTEPMDVVKSSEVRSHSASGARKGTKIMRPDLIPAKAIMDLAVHFGEGAAKYTEYDDDGNVTHDGSNNWRLGYEWSKTIAALERHLLLFKNGEDYDEDWPNGHPGSKHVIAVAWHALVLATYMDEHPELDDRWSTRQKPTYTDYVAEVRLTVDSLDDAGQDYVWENETFRYRWHNEVNGVFQWEMSALENDLEWGWLAARSAEKGPFTRAEKVEKTY